jgi:hypothetical protein
VQAPLHHLLQRLSRHLLNSTNLCSSSSSRQFIANAQAHTSFPVTRVELRYYLACKTTKMTAYTRITRSLGKHTPLRKVGCVAYAVSKQHF